MSTTAENSPRRSAGVITIGIAAVLLSATGQPTPKVLARLAEWGVPDLAARIAVHALPVVLIVSAVLLGQALGKGRSKTTRWIIYALLGGVAGFFTGYCMDLLVGVPATIEALNGPLAEPSVIDIGLWTLGGMAIAMGLMVAAIAAFGPPAAYAINIEPDIDPEAMDIRKPERAVFGLSSAGVVTLGLACIALAIARQSGEGATLGPSIVALVAGAACIFINILVWNQLDELQRRQVINAYAVSAVMFTAAAFVWSVADVQGLVAPLDAAAAFVAICLVQMVTASIITATSAGNARARRRTA
jgi:hypothetical protein